MSERVAAGSEDLLSRDSRLQRETYSASLTLRPVNPALIGGIVPGCLDYPLTAVTPDSRQQSHLGERAMIGSEQQANARYQDTRDAYTG